MRSLFGISAAIAGFAVLAAAPFVLGEYGLGLMIGMASYVTLATAWSLFSGPTRNVSLATAAFFGVGAYTVAVLSETVPYPVVLLAALVIGGGMAVLAGIATLRLSGVHFVIFTFGLAELVRQLITWYEVNVTGTLGRYIFLPIEARHIYWQLLGLAAITLTVYSLISRSRIGLALRVIGDDQLVASHSGIDIVKVKVALFALSAAIITLVGAVQAPRWVYVEPSIVFNPTTSFLVLIMALLGGPNRLWGAACGAIPLFLLFEWLSANFPNHYSIILGLLFIAIIYLLPNGILEWAEAQWARRRREPANDMPAAEAPR